MILEIGKQSCAASLSILWHYFDLLCLGIVADERIAILALIVRSATARFAMCYHRRVTSPSNFTIKDRIDFDLSALHI